ncbi:MAG: ATPase, T2SS/T4P/T4SS family, partial [Candidatus Altiarchaeota archaeon]
VSMEELVKNSLRQRPDRVLVGEVRGREAYNLLSAMNLGVHGIGTIHANNCRDAVSRLRSPPMNVPVQMLGNINVLVTLNRFQKGTTSERRVVEVVETGHIIKETLQIGDVYGYDPKKDEFIRDKFPAHIINNISERSGVSHREILLEQKRRKKILEYLVKHEVFIQHDFVAEIRKYYEDPKRYWEKVYAEIKKE